MNNISTISELLTLSGSQYRIYDIGRKVTKLSKEQFNKFELNQLPYPSPSQGHAELAIAFWQKQNSQPFLWFVKLPIDERSLLNQGARNHFIAIIIEALGEELSGEISKAQEELLSANPYHFTPAPYKLAALNSIINKTLSLPESQYYQACQQYFAGAQPWHEWQHLGLQGINDYCVRIDENSHTTKLISALQYLPEEVLSPVCSALENQPLPLALIESLLDKIEQHQKLHDAYPHYLLRALASNAEHPLVVQHVQQLLDSKQVNEETLIVIASRCWPILTQEVLAQQYLELMAAQCSSDFFAAIFKDLIAIPSIRPILLKIIRSTERSEALAKAIGLLFSAQ